jgi:hypothetical protein
MYRTCTDCTEVSYRLIFKAVQMAQVYTDTRLYSRRMFNRRLKLHRGPILKTIQKATIYGGQRPIQATGVWPRTERKRAKTPTRRCRLRLNRERRLCTGQRFAEPQATHGTETRKLGQIFVLKNNF